MGDILHISTTPDPKYCPRLTKNVIIGIPKKTDNKTNWATNTTGEKQEKNLRSSTSIFDVFSLTTKVDCEDGKSADAKSGHGATQGCEEETEIVGPLTNLKTRKFIKNHGRQFKMTLKVDMNSYAYKFESSEKLTLCAEFQLDLCRGLKNIWTSGEKKSEIGRAKIVLIVTFCFKSKSKMHQDEEERALLFQNFESR